jgi:uncharacterized membrane protein YeaQ/YmgE (transglycosylase-associated protein family)
MTSTGALVYLVVGSVCGSLGAGLAGYSHRGCLTSIVLGFLGAWGGRWIEDQLHLPAVWIFHLRGESFPAVWPAVGAAVFAAITSVFTARKPQGY